MTTPSDRTKRLADLAERSLWTFAQNFFGFLAVSSFLQGGALDASSTGLAAIAAVAGIVAVIQNVVLPRHPDTFLGDIVGRVLSTWFQSFVAIVIVAPGDIGTWSAAWNATLPSAIALVKSIVATRYGRVSAATLPQSVDTTTPYV